MWPWPRPFRGLFKNIFFGMLSGSCVSNSVKIGPKLSSQACLYSHWTDGHRTDSLLYILRCKIHGAIRRWFIKEGRAISRSPTMAWNIKEDVKDAHNIIKMTEWRLVIVYRWRPPGRDQLDRDEIDAGKIKENWRNIGDLHDVRLNSEASRNVTSTARHKYKYVCVNNFFLIVRAYR